MITTQSELQMEQLRNADTLEGENLGRKYDFVRGTSLVFLSDSAVTCAEYLAQQREETGSRGKLKLRASRVDS